MSVLCSRRTCLTRFNGCAKAQQSGNLKTTTEQKVIVEEKIIKIEPANPQVVYVPTYNPTVVYGTWPYPAYPPYPWYPPGYVATAAFSFAAGWGTARRRTRSGRKGRTRRSRRFETDKRRWGTRWARGPKWWWQCGSVR